MLVSQPLSWPTTNLPDPTVAASQYTVYQVFPGSPTIVATETTNNTLLSYDDTASLIYQIRPSQGRQDDNTLVVGASILSYVVGYIPCGGWLRQKIRKALADRGDNTQNTTLAWPDDEINEFIQEAMIEIGKLFPQERAITINLLGPTIDSHNNMVGVKNYALPSDFLFIQSVEYVTAGGHLHYFLRDKPWRGGESTATSFYGYPKLGMLFSPTMMAGRIFPGHFQIYEKELQLDWDPCGDREYLNVNYLGVYTLPTDDITPLNCSAADLELFNLYAQLKCWLRVEGQDASISRWRGLPDGSQRDGLPTVKHSTIVKNLYNERI